jgi:PST family polysaccharide transporter
VRSIARATAILGSSSFASLVVGLVSAKVWAVLVGPTGVGFLGLLQSLVGLSGLIAGLGVGTGLVRLGSAALAEGNARRVAALERAAWLLCWGLGGAAALALVIASPLTAVAMLGRGAAVADAALMAVPVLFGLAAGVQVGRLNAHHRVKALALNGVLNSALGAILSLGIVWRFGAGGIAPAVVASSVVTWLVPTLIARRELVRADGAASRAEVLDAARALLRFGAPYTMSSLVGTGVQFLLPSLVLHTLGPTDVGFYRAAATVTGTYLGFLLSAMGQDYYPRLSAVADSPGALVGLVNQQHRLVMLTGAPVIVGMLAVAPVLVPLVYSPAFEPTVRVLQWQLAADLFKFSSWTLGFLVLVRGGSGAFFVTELIAGVTLLGSSWLGARWLGLPGLGVAMLVTYIVYYAAVWTASRQALPFAWTVENRALFAGALVAVAAIEALGALAPGGLRLPLAVAVAVAFGGSRAVHLWRDLRGTVSA